MLVFPFNYNLKIEYYINLCKLIFKLNLFKMGKIDSNIVLKEFTDVDIKNKELVLKMLKYEDKYYNSMEGQKLIRRKGMHNITSLEGGKTIQRLTLKQFGYNPNDESLAKYRRIFHNYYNNSRDYDKDILKSVYYMRENRLLYYTTPKINIGDIIPNCKLYDIGLGTNRDLYNILNETNNKQVILASYSMS